MIDKESLFRHMAQYPWCYVRHIQYAGARGMGVCLLDIARIACNYLSDYDKMNIEEFEVRYNGHSTSRF